MAKKKPQVLERGVALVEAVIAKIEADGGTLAACGIPEGKPEPLTAAQISALQFPGGKPIPPSLARFLAYDARYLGLFDDLNEPSFGKRTFRDMMVREFDEQTADTYDFSELLPGDCYCVPGGSDSRRFLYVGRADDAGEYPVLVVDTDDVPFVCVEYPGLDVYLAAEFGTFESEGADTYAGLFNDPQWAPAMEAQARLNLHGFKSFDFGAGDTEHVDGEEAAEQAMASLMPSVDDDKTADFEA